MNSLINFNRHCPARPHGVINPSNGFVRRRASARLAIAVIAGLWLAVSIGCSGRGTQEATATDFSIAVFVPGVVEGSPTYEMLVAGVGRAAAEHPNVAVHVVEGGFNQAEWGQALTSLAATGEHDIIISSNPAVPEIVAGIAPAFPDQRFVVLDGYMPDHGQIATVMFNQREQAFLSGYFAGLVTTSEDLENANPAKVIGMLAGQEYPIMNDAIIGGYRLGARAVDPAITVDLRVLGNWYDATGAAELTRSMVSGGADVILTIAGGGNQGVIAAAREHGAYVLWYDSSGYDEARGTVIGSSIVRQDTMAYEMTKAVITGTLEFPYARVVGVADGYVDFDTDHQYYRDFVPAAIQTEMDRLIERMRSGELVLEMPAL